MTSYFDLEDEKTIRQYFTRSVVLKGLISFAEVVVGIIIFFIPLSFLADICIDITNRFLTGNLAYFVATQITHISQSVSIIGGTFLAIYLFSRGGVKLGLMFALLKGKLWAYPASLIVLGILILYQLYQLTISYSHEIVALTMFDLVVMYFIWKEYKILAMRNLKKIQSN